MWVCARVYIWQKYKRDRIKIHAREEKKEKLPSNKVFARRQVNVCAGSFLRISNVASFDAPILQCALTRRDLGFFLICTYFRSMHIVNRIVIERRSTIAESQKTVDTFFNSATISFVT